MTPEWKTVTTFMRFIIRLTGFQIAVCMRRFERPARATSRIAASGNPGLTLWRQIALIAAIACIFAAGQAQANGKDPNVVAGQASFSTQGSTLSITNNPGAIIHWQGFSIYTNEITRFIQQSAASSVLNRVIGPDPSVILGTLTSNGRVFLINPSGIRDGRRRHRLGRRRLSGQESVSSERLGDLCQPGFHDQRRCHHQRQWRQGDRLV